MNDIVRRCRLGILVIVAALAAAVPVWTQSRSLPDSPGTWKPWKPLVVGVSARRAQAATPALVKAFETELLALNAIVHRAPGVVSPVGFSVETWGSFGGYHMAEHAPGQPAAGGVPIIGGFTFAAFPIFEYERNGKMVRSDTGETAQQLFEVNDISGDVMGRGGVAEWTTVSHDAFFQPMPQGEIAGLPRYADMLIIARDPAALWTPLSQRGALDLVVAARQQAVEDAEMGVADLTARLAVVRDPAWRATRVADAREPNPSIPNAAAFVKQVEELIVTEESEIVKDLAPSGNGAGKWLVDARRALAEVTGWIAELSATDQAAASCYAEIGATLRAKFRTVRSADCRPLVRPNYGYFNKALPRSAAQVLVIRPITRCFDTANKNNGEANDPSPAGCRANRALIETLDKNAVRAWLHIAE